MGKRVCMYGERKVDKPLVEWITLLIAHVAQLAICTSQDQLNANKVMAVAPYQFYVQ